MPRSDPVGLRLPVSDPGPADPHPLHLDASGDAPRRAGIRRIIFLSLGLVSFLRRIRPCRRTRARLTGIGVRADARGDEPSEERAPSYRPVSRSERRLDQVDRTTKPPLTLSPAAWSRPSPPRSTARRVSTSERQCRQRPLVARAAARAAVRAGRRRSPAAESSCRPSSAASYVGSERRALSEAHRCRRGRRAPSASPRRSQQGASARSSSSASIMRSCRRRDPRRGAPDAGLSRHTALRGPACRRQGRCAGNFGALAPTP